MPARPAAPTLRPPGGHYEHYKLRPEDEELVLGERLEAHPATAGPDSGRRKLRTFRGPKYGASFEKLSSIEEPDVKVDRRLPPWTSTEPVAPGPLLRSSL